MLSEEKIIEKYKIKENDKVLDVGGSMMQRTKIKIHTLVDIIRPENAPYSSSKLNSANFVRVDLTKDTLPFKDKTFDFCLCTHTLEDLYNPFLIISEMSRVAKRGFITTPSMGADMVFSDFDITNWMTGGVRVPGHSHHKWFFVLTKKGLKIIPKNYGILYSSRYHLTKWLGEKEMQYYWEEKINHRQVSDLNIHSLIDEYEDYLSENKNKYNTGLPLLFLDKPGVLVKAYVKLLLKNGNGYKFRKKIK